MLIKVFGVWLMASNIATLNPDGSSECEIYFVNSGRSYIMQEIERPCDEVAEEINRQIKESK